MYPFIVSGKLSFLSIFICCQFHKKKNWRKMQILRFVEKRFQKIIPCYFFHFVEKWFLLVLDFLFSWIKFKQNVFDFEMQMSTSQKKTFKFLFYLRVTLIKIVWMRKFNSLTWTWILAFKIESYQFVEKQSRKHFFWQVSWLIPFKSIDWSTLSKGSESDCPQALK